MKEILGGDKFGFRRNKGTREAILAVRLVMENTIEEEKTAYIGFVNL